MVADSISKVPDVNGAQPNRQPALVDVGGVVAPPAPGELQGIDVGEQVVLDCALKLAGTTPHFTTEWASQQLCLPLQVTDEVYWRLQDDHMVEVLGQLGPFRYRYAPTQRGREFANRLLEISGYVGPVPVTLQSYNSMILWESGQLPPITLPRVQDALSHLVFDEHTVEVAALAAASGRSLFLFGPAGNGKTSIGRALHAVAYGEFWIPHCISIDAHIIRIYDPQHHQLAEVPEDTLGDVDRRWVRIRRPFVVVGGEMTLDQVELTWSPSLRFYEAPLQIKANGGIFFIDDLGRQRVKPEDLLNRWIVPLENRVDYLSLMTGQKIEIPFCLMLVIATNLTVSEVADPAFLRRMGYRLHVHPPDERGYQRIFQEYAARHEMELPDEALVRVLQRYHKEGRELRASEPRDLIERAKDICRLRGVPHRLSIEVLDTAWKGYFGNH